MRIVDLNALEDQPVNTDLLVYTKSTWTDTFAFQPNLIVEEVSWTVAPKISVASLHWRYGNEVFAPRSSQSTVVSPITNRGYYVLIVQELGDGNRLSWLGFADLPVTIQYDDVSGVQQIPCFGFDRALQYSAITTTVHVDSSDAERWLRNDLGAVFNEHIKGNRSDAKVKLSEDDPAPTLYAFENPSVEKRKWWSTQAIVQHLALFHLPTFDNVAGDIPWNITGFDRIPDWDRPRLETDGRTLHECFEELSNADRMLGWRVMPQVSFSGTTPTTLVPTVDSIDIEFFSRAGSSVSLPGVTDLPANHDIQVWTHVRDRVTDSTVDDDDSEVVDQIIVRGPREIAVGTFRWESEWIAGWTPTELTEYITAYSDRTFWAGKTEAEKRELNQYFRGLSKYEDVYRTFPIDDDWDGSCNGEPLFYLLKPEDPNYVPYLGNVKIMPRLPLFRGVDYSGGVDTVNEERGRDTMPILAYIEHPGYSNRYTPVQTAFNDFGAPRIKYPNALEFEIRIAPYFDRGPGFRFDVQGAPQHAHRPSFTGNEADPENNNAKMWGKLDSETMLITAAMMGDRRPEVRIPDTVDADIVRKRYITLEHRGLEHVTIAAATVVGIDHKAELDESEGGTLRDPFDMLTGLANLAAERYLKPRKTAKIKSGRVINVEPGGLIKSINGDEVNAVISEVRISTPVSESESPPPYTIVIHAVDNDMDLASLIGRVPEPEIDQ